MKIIKKIINKILSIFGKKKHVEEVVYIEDLQEYKKKVRECFSGKIKTFKFERKTINKRVLIVFTAFDKNKTYTAYISFYDENRILSLKDVENTLSIKKDEL